MLANAWSLADRAARPCAYKITTLDALLSKGKYSTKLLSAAEIHLQTSETSNGPCHKRQKVVDEPATCHRCSSPINIRDMSALKDCTYGWRMDHSDPLLYCKETQSFRWLSINRPSALPFHGGNILLPNDVSNVQITTSCSANDHEPVINFPNDNAATPYIAVDLFLASQLPIAPTHRDTFQTCVKRHLALVRSILNEISPVVLIVVCPGVPHSFDEQMPTFVNASAFPSYTMLWNIVPSSPNPSSNAPSCASLVIFFAKISLHTEADYDFHAQSELTAPNTMLNEPTTQVLSPICTHVWDNILQFVCRNMIAPHIEAELERNPIAAVFHAQPSPK